MKVTLRELQERLAERLDPDALVDLLDVSSEDIVEAFPEKVDEKFDILITEYFDEEEDSPDDYHSGE